MINYFNIKTIGDLRRQYISITGLPPEKLLLTELQYQALFYENNLIPFTSAYGMTVSISDKMTLM